VVYAAKHAQTALDGERISRLRWRSRDASLRPAWRSTSHFVLFRLVRDNVMEATAGRQEPYTYGSLPGREDFFFVNKQLVGAARGRLASCPPIIFQTRSQSLKTTKTLDVSSSN
jgi:hypothetical protein